MNLATTARHFLNILMGAFYEDQKGTITPHIPEKEPQQETMQ